MNDKDIRKAILEGVELDKAEVVLAAKAIVADLQDAVIRLSRIQAEELDVLKDGIIAAFGADIASNFIDRADKILERTIEANKISKEKMDAEVALLAGDNVNLLGLARLDDVEKQEKAEDLNDIDVAPELGREKKHKTTESDESVVAEKYTENRFEDLLDTLRRRGVKDPEGLAAFIAKKKFSHKTKKAK